MDINIFDYDRVDYNPENNGVKFYGKDNEDGTTDWYDENGNLDCTTETPDCDEEYQERIE